MQHDREIISSFRKTLRPFDNNGNYQPLWIVYNNDYDRVFCSRFYYQNQNERLNVYFLHDGSVIISDQLDKSVYYAS